MRKISHVYEYTIDFVSWGQNSSRLWLKLVSHDAIFVVRAIIQTFSLKIFACKGGTAGRRAIDFWQSFRLLDGAVFGTCGAAATSAA